MNCRACESLVSAYLDGELTGWQMIDVRKHLDACPSCSQELNELRLLKSSLASSPDFTSDECLHDRMMAGVQRRAAVGGRTWTVASLAVATGVCAVFAATVVFARLNQPLQEGSVAEGTFNSASDRVYSGGADPFSNHVQGVPVGFR